MATTPSLRTGSLCTGYGGLDLAVENLFDSRLQWVADPDPGSSHVLAHRWPTTPNLGDLRTIDWENIPAIDILTAGFPCQPVSSAGRRRGTHDERWLFDDILAGIRRMPQRPALLIFENVRGLLTANQGTAMRTVVQGLARDGFLAQWRILRASDVGAPHQRARIFLTARDTLRDRRGMGPDRIGAAHPRPSDQTVPSGAGDHRTGGERGVDPALWRRFTPAVQRWEHVTGRKAPFPAEIGPRGARISTRWLEWTMGLPEGWVTDVPELSHAVQRRLLGNGVVPQQASAAIEDLLAWPTPAYSGG